ncbi:prolyl endopeptidase, partial [Vibrio parahaemolyticus AQ3810]
SFQFIVE